MSREFIYYPAVKENGEYRPFLTPDGEPMALIWRNAKGHDDVMDNFSRFDLSELDDTFRDYFNVTDGDEPIYLLKDYETYADDGLIRGYATTEDAIEYFNGNWDIDVIPTQVYADLPERERRDYIKFSYVDTASFGYVCSVLYNFSLANQEEIVFIVVYSY